MTVGIAILEICWLLLVASSAIAFAIPLPHISQVAGSGVWMATPAVVSCAVAYYYNDLYDPRIVRDFKEFCYRLPRTLILASLFLLAYCVAARTLGMSLDLLTPTPVGALVVIASSVPLRWGAYAVAGQLSFSERVLILGTGPLACSIAREIKSVEGDRLSILGSLEDSSAGNTPSLFPAEHALQPMLGSLDQLEEVIQKLRPDRVVVALAERRSRLPIQELLRHRVNGVKIEDGIATYERLVRKLAIESLTPSSLLFSDAFRQSKLLSSFQRAVSLFGALVGLILTAPLMAIVAVLIKIDSRGPVFFVQRRAGLQGRPFNLIKFRTMLLVSAEEETSFWAEDNDARITRLGRWLRRFRLDELPQFINVLRGEMNLIGPRPHPVANAALFREQIPYYSLREMVRPGLTGWAQVRNGYANGLAGETEKMRYDLYYIKNMSCGLDLRILVDTAKTVISDPGS